MPAGVIVTALSPFAHFTIVTGMLALWGTVLTGCLTGLLIFFFRDPDRVPPRDADVIVSPADGLVVYVREIQAGQLPEATKKGRSYQLRELSGTALGGGRVVAIGISMNLVNVHVNRAPLAGRVTLVRHIPGTFGSLRNPEMILSNERNTILIETTGLQVAIVQIASRLVRRIVTFTAEGDTVRAGQRIGAIRFGSQVDLLIPAIADIRVAVREGDHVVAGQTIVAVIATNSSRENCEEIRDRGQYLVNHDGDSLVKGVKPGP
jgi:phosphatidylserine decarboxylase